MRRLLPSISFVALRRATLIAVLVFTSCAYSLALAHSTGSAPSLWIANGVLVGSLLRLPTRDWWLYLLFGFSVMVGAALLLHISLLVALGLAAADALEILVVCCAVRRQFPEIPDVVPYLSLGRVALTSTLVACALSALLAGLTVHIAQGAPLLAFAETWYRAHVLGMVIVATFVWVAFTERWELFGPPGKRWPFVRDMALIAGTTFAVFAQSRYPLLFLIYAPLLLAVFRHRFAGLVVGIALIAAITNIATALGSGPFNLILGGSRTEHALLAQVFLGVACLISVPLALVLAERRHLEDKVRESELRYRILADYAGDLVMRIRPDGQRRYVSPSIKELLGWDVEEFSMPRPDLIHPDDRERVARAVAELHRTGGSTITTYRIRHKDGRYVWFEALARLVPSPEGDGVMEIIYTGRDITQRVIAEQALADSEQRLRTITDNVPAVIAHVDASERYTFVNAYVEHVSGEDPRQMIGKTMREVRGEQIYGDLQGHIATALGGGAAMFEYEADYKGKHHCFQTNFVPDRDPEGCVRGFYALTTDITHIKDVEQELTRLARFDTLTGLANRRHFDERIAVLLLQKYRQRSPLLLMMIDIDHFKCINDSWGHGVGDEVLKAVGQRLQGCLRKNDLVARLGGDEFVALVEDVESSSIAEELTRKIQAAMAQEITVGAIRIQMTLSIGMALCQSAASADAFMQLADAALYEAKAGGRNTFRMAIHEPRALQEPAVASKGIRSR
ncbi:sensor domain-containing diguanylate cyclase [Rhodanobacter sp. OK091]|uniref:sensor domain-containing diguanylate cyclase n=1 Tax=Rhodanobacter sp. OK091 TaxID=1881037 RepID=UPI0009225B8B|nr:sensor domain-containing diguanylate cyclase [Rhodanobacter sp. OK091]SHL88160.1 PAS domain S-box-containing protein/diguanylate cyclase (GGDEF) domain-containing protein [Rhodanobacter sp. OK091]